MRAKGEIDHLMTLASTEKKQIATITVAAVAVFVGMRFMPTGTNLNHMDFRVSGQNAIEFCDPANPQFIPVVAVKSPVTMALKWDAAPTAGRAARGTVVLSTSNGKPIEPQDLLVAHTRKLHLLIVDPTLTDYQHVHPEPGRARGEWAFGFTPRRGGEYRVFADFTPAATARGLYASADVTVAGTAAAESAASGGVVGERRSAGERPPYVFELKPAVAPIRAGQVADISFSVTRADGGDVVLAPVMDAYAHLVALDEARSGFAHLHPGETDLARKPDAKKPTLTFKITIPREGRYVIWAQMNLDGREVFEPFAFDVVK